MPVPLLLIWAPSWGWIVAANVLLGISQGLTWSTTIVMKIDLVGPPRAGSRWGSTRPPATGPSRDRLDHRVARRQYGLRPAPFLLGVAFAALGLGLSTIWYGRPTIRPPRGRHPHRPRRRPPRPPERALSVRRDLHADQPREHALSSASQAGLVNNLNDGLAWGLFPILFAASGLAVGRIGVLAAVYPAVWGIGPAVHRRAVGPVGPQMVHRGRHVLQAPGLALVAAGGRLRVVGGRAVLIGAGTAMVYPTLLAVHRGRRPPAGGPAPSACTGVARPRLCRRCLGRRRHRGPPRGPGRDLDGCRADRASGLIVAVADVRNHHRPTLTAAGHRREPPMGDRAAKDALFAEFAAVGKALGSPKRLELLDLLAQGPRSVEDLARAADVGLSTCSAHLQRPPHRRPRGRPAATAPESGTPWPATTSPPCSREPAQRRAAAPPAHRARPPHLPRPGRHRSRSTLPTCSRQSTRPATSSSSTSDRHRSTPPGTCPEPCPSHWRSWSTGSPSCPRTGRWSPTAAVPLLHPGPRRRPAAHRPRPARARGTRHRRRPGVANRRLARRRRRRVNEPATAGVEPVGGGTPTGQRRSPAAVFTGGWALLVRCAPPVMNPLRRRTRDPSRRCPAAGSRSRPTAPARPAEPGGPTSAGADLSPAGRAAAPTGRSRSPRASRTRRCRRHDPVAALLEQLGGLRGATSTSAAVSSPRSTTCEPASSGTAEEAVAPDGGVVDQRLVADDGAVGQRGSLRCCRGVAPWSAGCRRRRRHPAAPGGRGAGQSPHRGWCAPPRPTRAVPPSA